MSGLWLKKSLSIVVAAKSVYLKQQADAGGQMDCVMPGSKIPGVTAQGGDGENYCNI